MSEVSLEVRLLGLGVLGAGALLLGALRAKSKVATPLPVEVLASRRSRFKGKARAAFIRSGA